MFQKDKPLGWIQSNFLTIHTVYGEIRLGMMESLFPRLQLDPKLIMVPSRAKPCPRLIFPLLPHSKQWISSDSNLRGHLAKSGNVSDCHSQGVLPFTDGQRPGRVPNTLQCTRQPHVTELCGPNVRSAECRKSVQNVKYLTLLLTKERTVNRLLCRELVRIQWLHF